MIAFGGDAEVLIFNFGAIAVLNLLWFVNQSEEQLAVATRCGYPLVWISNERAAADFFDGVIRAPIQYRPFPCHIDSE